MERCELRAGWQLQCAALAPGGGAEVSRENYDPAGWYPVQAPVTALRAMVEAGVYPDPRRGLQTYEIPDSSDEFNAAHDLAQFSHLPDQQNPWRSPWWYRTAFDLPSLTEGQRVWLDLECLNYRADVWLNGELIADREQVKGMFQRFRLDLSDWATAGANVLAVLVYPVDHPGTPETQLEVYGKVRGFHGELMRDVTEVMTLGYDCFPTVPDRNLGLVQGVAVEITGPVDLRHPFVRADLDFPDLDPARLTLSAELVNTSPGPVSGQLAGEITDPQGRLAAVFAQEVTLAPGETRLVTLTPAQCPELLLPEPQLWWPRGYGDQPLYRLELAFASEGQVSAAVHTSFGLRRLDRELHEHNEAHGFVLRVNGVKVFQRGGYVQPEMMFDWDRERVAAELRYLAEANLNYIVFEDIPNPPDYYLDLCDQLGLMFWNCFYDCYWLQPTTQYPDDLALLEDCTVDLVKRYRNHPCLTIYMSQNEGETREPVYTMWRRRVLELDDTRFLVPSGSFPSYRVPVQEWFAAELPVGMNDYPPKAYSWQSPRTYYRWVREEGNWMFMIESGAASVPPLESLEQFIPQLRGMGPNPGDPLYPLDPTWAHYGANGYFEWFDRALRHLYGEPADVRDYVWKAHLLGYDQHRAFFEAVHHRMWDITSGFGEWKINSSFPDVQWQLYDWFLRPMVSLFAIRKACALVAVQLSPLEGMVTAVSNLQEPLPGLRLRAAVYDLAAQCLHEQEAALDLPANGYRDVFVLPQPTDAAASPVYFVKLELRDERGTVLADNFYWLSPCLNDCALLHQGEMRAIPANKPLEIPRAQGCLAALGSLPPVTLEVLAQRVSDVPAPAEARLAVRLHNPTDQLAFFIRLRVTRGEGGEEVLPAYWTDNFVSLLPGETREVGVTLPGQEAGALTVAVDGWNIPARSARVVGH